MKDGNIHCGGKIRNTFFDLAIALFMSGELQKCEEKQFSIILTGDSADDTKPWQKINDEP